MNTFLNIALYWDAFMWTIGALVATGALIIALLWVCQILLGAWRRTIFSELRVALWIYQAMRSWERAGNPPPGKVQVRDEKDQIERHLRRLLIMAMEHGYIVTVENKPRTLWPWAIATWTTKCARPAAVTKKAATHEAT